MASDPITPIKTKQHILVVGCSTKAGSAVCRQFHKAGYLVTVFDWTNLPNKWSRYVSNYVGGTSPEIDAKATLSELLNELSKGEYEALLPLTDVALELVREFSHVISNHVKIMGLNNSSVYRYAHDKFFLLEQASSFNIVGPSTVLITDEPAARNLNVNYPCVLKPIHSAKYHNGRVVTFKVRIIRNHNELIDVVRELVHIVPLMVQEKVGGSGLGYNFIAENGRVISAYVHRRVTEPEEGGVSTNRESCDENEFDLKNNVRAFIQSTGWHGVGMMEFKVNGTEYMLMELNGRFFGSVEVGIRSGVNLPLMFLQQQLQSNLTFPLKPMKSGIRVRNLHDELFLKLIALKKGHFKTTFSWIWDVLIGFFSKKNYIEDNWFEDPGFVTGLYFWDLMRVFRKLWQRIELPMIRSSAKILKAEEMNDRVVFICFGNICRSPFAGAVASKLFNSKTFFSAGTYPVEGRRSPMNAVTAANKFNVDLLQHSSLYLSKEHRREFDCFVVMDALNYLQLRKMGISRNKIRFLTDPEIKDPYGHDLKQFEQVYQTIYNRLEAIKNESLT